MVSTLITLVSRVNLSVAEWGVYDCDQIKAYTDEEFAEMDSFIDHERDMLFTYAELRQVVDKYLVQTVVRDRFTRHCGIYILIAATLFQKYPTTSRMTMSGTTMTQSQTQNQHSHTCHGGSANST